MTSNRHNTSRPIPAPETLSVSPSLLPSTGLRPSLMPERWPAAGLRLVAPALGFVHVLRLNMQLPTRAASVDGVARSIPDAPSGANAAAAFPTESRLMPVCVHHSCGTSKNASLSSNICKLLQDSLIFAGKNDYERVLLAKNAATNRLIAVAAAFNTIHKLLTALYCANANQLAKSFAHCWSK